MNRKRLTVALLALAAGAFAVVRWARSPAAGEASLVASGTIEATDAQLGFQHPGRIAVLQPREGDRVAAGQELARLDTAELEARRAQAVAQVGAAEALLEELLAGSRREEVAQATAALAAAEARLEDAERDVARTRTLHEGRAVAREALEKAALQADLARRQRDQASEQLALLRQGPRPERIAAARAQLAQAEAAVAAVDATLGNARLLAPFDGVVTVRHREPGEIVAAGAPVVTLLDPHDRWVRIFVPENRLGGVALGQAAEITADTFAGKVYAGEVAFIASEAEFTPKNVQTAEERVRLVYAVKVRINGDPSGELKPGLPADVRLVTAR